MRRFLVLFFAALLLAGCSAAHALPVAAPSLTAVPLYTATTSPTASPTATTPPTNTATPTIAPTDTPAPTSTTTATPAGYHPFIAPELTNIVPSALVRLQSCQPSIYATVSKYAMRFELNPELPTSGEVPSTIGYGDGIIFLSPFFLTRHFSADADQLYLAATIAHETHHLQDFDLDLMGGIDELGAYQFELPVLSCPTTSPSDVAEIRTEIERRIANPPTPVYWQGH